MKYAYDVHIEAGGYRWVPRSIPETPAILSKVSSIGSENDPEANGGIFIRLLPVLVIITRYIIEKKTSIILYSYL